MKTSEITALKRNDIPLTWKLAYVGIQHHWLSPADVMKDIDNDAIQVLTADVVADLYSKADDSAESFLSCIGRFTDLNEMGLSNALRIWAFSFLMDVKNSNDHIALKLQNIAAIWAMIGYPDHWKGFIHYMPVKSGEPVGEEIVYGRFLSFMGDEASALELNDVTKARAGS